MRKATMHKTDIMLDADKLKKHLDKRGWSFTTLYDNIVKEYGVDLSYKGFMNLIGNRSSWKLLYGYIISDMMKIEISDIFYLVEVDIDKKKIEKEKWVKKYQNRD